MAQTIEEARQELDEQYRKVREDLEDVRMAMIAVDQAGPRTTSMIAWRRWRRRQARCAAEAWSAQGRMDIARPLSATSRSSAADDPAAGHSYRCRANSSSRRMRSAIGGWVANICASPVPRNGLAIIR